MYLTKVSKQVMSKTRKPLEIIDVDNDDDMIIASSTPKKLDFTSTRKKGRTPKKRGLFTPMKISADIKPKLEPASPISPTTAPIRSPGRATRAKTVVVQPKIEPGLEEIEVEDETGPTSKEIRVDTALNVDVLPQEDVKPDVRALESLLGGLNLEHPATGNSIAALSRVDLSPSPSPAREASSMNTARRSTTPLFLSYDSPDQSPSSEQLNLSPASATSSLHNSPRFRARSPVVLPQAAVPSTTADLFDLFSSDSPPPPARHMRPPSASSSVSDAVPAIYHTDSEQDSPIAGPSQTRIAARTNPTNGCQRRPRSASASSSHSSANGPDFLADVKPDLASLQVIEDVKPVISLQTTTRSSRPRRRAFLEFLDTVAKADSEPEDDYEYHLDESEGSLKDFIVDDDEVSYISDSEGSLREFDSEEEDSDVVEVNVDPGADSDEDSDMIIEEAVSHPKIGRVSGLDFLEDYDISEDEVEDTRSEPEDLLEAIDNLTIAGKTGKGKTKAKKGLKAPKWAIERVRIAQEVFDDLDKRVFDGQLGPNGAGAKIIWNKRLLTTAGTAQRKRRRHAGGETSWDLAIQLSEKVCTGEEQVLSTVAHEMCHLASWVIDKEFKNPHGKVFKSWGRKVMRKRSDLEVTTKHDYVIEYKYHWRCIDCKKVYKRHSKSIDIEKLGCGVCKGKLQALFETKSRGTSTFQVYLKQNMKTVKAALPGASHGDVMRALSARWNEAGAEADHEAHWKAVLAAARG